MQNDLYHFGVKGMHWGIRRYQNADGTLTAEGKAKYGSQENFQVERDRIKSRNKKIAIGATIAVGAIAAGIVVAKNPQIVAAGSKFAKAMYNRLTGQSAKTVSNGRAFLEKSMRVNQKASTMGSSSLPSALNMDEIRRNSWIRSVEAQRNGRWQLGAVHAK